MDPFSAKIDASAQELFNNSYTSVDQSDEISRNKF